MAKYTYETIAGLGTNVLAAQTTINSNFAAVMTAMEKTLSRDGTTPNQMEADLDMNSNQILNLPLPVDDTEPVRKGEFDALDAEFDALEITVNDTLTTVTNALNTLSNAANTAVNASVAALAAQAAADNTFLRPFRMLSAPKLIFFIHGADVDAGVPAFGCFTCLSEGFHRISGIFYGLPNSHIAKI